jgi:hypothetical protein
MIEHQTQLNTAMYRTPIMWKAYLCSTRLNPVPVSFCIEKSQQPFLSTHPVARVNLQTQHVSTTQHTLPPPHMEHNPTKLVDRLNPALNKTENNRQWIVIYHWHRCSGGVKQWTNLREQQWGKEPNSVSWGRMRNKHWKQELGEKPTSNSGSVVDQQANLMGLWVMYKIDLLHFFREGTDQPELQL